MLRYDNNIQISEDQKLLVKMFFTNQNVQKKIIQGKIYNKNMWLVVIIKKKEIYIVKYLEIWYLNVIKDSKKHNLNKIII